MSKVERRWLAVTATRAGVNVHVQRGNQRFALMYTAEQARVLADALNAAADLADKLATIPPQEETA
jgi:hypothetical protein